MVTVYRAGNASSYTEWKKELSTNGTYQDAPLAFLYSGTSIPRYSKINKITTNWQVYGEDRLIEANVFSVVSLYTRAENGTYTYILEGSEKEKSKPNGNWHDQSQSVTYTGNAAIEKANLMSSAKAIHILVYIRKTNTFVAYTTGIRNVVFTIEWDYLYFTLTTYTQNGSIQTKVNNAITSNTSVQGGANVTITAVPNNGYEFAQWSDGVTDISRSFTMDGDKSFTAEFEAVSLEPTRVLDLIVEPTTVAVREHYNVFVKFDE